MADNNLDRITRILDLSARLEEGQIINKELVSDFYQVNERTIRRDIEMIRAYLAEKETRDGIHKEIVYDPVKKGYVLVEENQHHFNNGEVLAVSKILLESRAFTKTELTAIINKLLNGCIPAERRKQIRELIGNEEYYYIPLKHNHLLTELIWELGQAISGQKKIRLYYKKINGDIIDRIVKPVGIMFSEFYFYLIAFIDSEKEKAELGLSELSGPAIYRVDRIQDYKILKEHFQVPYKDRFQEGEFRKRVQFMYGGPLRRVKFEYSGPSVEAVLDRLPTAEILSEKDGVYTITAEVYGDGVDMWLRSQGDKIGKIYKN